MNKERRARIQNALVFVEKAKEILEEISDEEQECYDNLTEGLQATERGEQIQENVCKLEEFINCLEETDYLEEM